MLSRDVTTWPWGGDVPPPGPPMHAAVPDEPAGLSGMPPASRLEGRQHTLTLTGPAGAGDDGYTGRDIYDGTGVPLNEGRGMFSRLHEEGAS